MKSQPEWYQGDNRDPSFDPAHAAFDEAKSVFENEITKDSQKKALLQAHSSLDDILTLVSTAKAQYDDQHKQRKVSKWLARLSGRVQFYGNIMDVMVQHHPEYVSLAWGALKLLFTLVLNHEGLITGLAKALCQISESLPRVALATMLYPTPRMKHAVAQLYAQIISFFIRAKQWYSESKARHIWDSLARPFELRYADLITNIEIWTKEIESLANAASQAEQRDMHLKLVQVGKQLESSEAMLNEMRNLMITHQAINTSAQLDTNSRLTDLQFNQIMSFLSKGSESDYIQNLRWHTNMLRNMSLRNRSLDPQRVCMNSRFQNWQNNKNSALLVVRGDYAARKSVRKFSVDMINLLRDNGIAVVWALRPIVQEGAQRMDAREVSVTDLIKGLVLQLLRLNAAQQTESSIGINCARFRAAETEDDWLDLLASTLSSVRHLFVIIDLEMVGKLSTEANPTFSWLVAFQKVFEKLSAQRAPTTAKVIMFSYGSAMLQLGNIKDHANIVVDARRFQSNMSAHTKRMVGKSPKKKWKSSMVARAEAR